MSKVNWLSLEPPQSRAIRLVLALIALGTALWLVR